MNRNLDGTLLTIAQLEDIALKAGISEHDLESAHTVNEKAALWHSWLLEHTAELRLAMLWAGELVSAVEVWVCPEPKPLTIDLWFLAQKEAS